MEINAEQMEALLRLQEQQATVARKQTSAGGAFEALLNQEMGLATQAADTSGVLSTGAAQAGMISQMLLNNVGQVQETDPEVNLLQEAFTQASGTLDLWDSYAQALGGTESGSLRDAYALLQGIDSQVAQIKQDTASVRGKNPDFDDLLNTLEVMTVTEKFKFNRGDYNA